MSETINIIIADIKHIRSKVDDLCVDQAVVKNILEGDDGLVRKVAKHENIVQNVIGFFGYSVKIVGITSLVTGMIFTVLRVFF